jgi:hypothetical protein
MSDRGTKEKKPLEMVAAPGADDFTTLCALRRINQGGQIVARKTILVCDQCGSEVGEGKGATMRLNFTDARRGSKQADLCDNCAGNLPGQSVARRGRRPKSAVA